MSDDPKFHAAINQEICWKNPELQRFAVALVRRALESGRPHFTTDIVPDADRGAGPGIAGSVVELLKNANVIRPVGHNSGGAWFALRVKSTRPDRKSAWLNVYQLSSAGMAEAFLRRHGSTFAARPQQMDFLPTARLEAIAR